MENDSRRRAFKFFITACVISAMYYFVMENIVPAVEVDGGSREIMGVPARIIAVAKNEKKAKRAIATGFDELKRINRLLSEEPNKINRGPVKVSPELFEVLQTGIDYSKLTKGAFDITVADANTHARYEKLILDAKSQTVRFANSRIQLKLGGIGKGFAVDKAAEIMKRKGAIGGLVDAGGIIRCFGKPAHKGNWLVSIGKVKSYDVNDTGIVLKLRDCAAASKVGGVTVIAQRAVDAEVIASAVSAMGVQKGLDLVDSLLGVEAIIDTDGKVVTTERAGSYIQ